MWIDGHRERTSKRKTGKADYPHWSFIHISCLSEERTVVNYDQFNCWLFWVFFNSLCTETNSCAGCWKSCWLLLSQLYWEIKHRWDVMRCHFLSKLLLKSVCSPEVSKTESNVSERRKLCDWCRAGWLKDLLGCNHKEILRGK